MSYFWAYNSEQHNNKMVSFFMKLSFLDMEIRNDRAVGAMIGVAQQRVGKGEGPGRDLGGSHI